MIFSTAETTDGARCRAPFLSEAVEHEEDESNREVGRVVRRCKTMATVVVSKITGEKRLHVDRDSPHRARSRGAQVVNLVPALALVSSNSRLHSQSSQVNKISANSTAGIHQFDTVTPYRAVGTCVDLLSTVVPVVGEWITLAGKVTHAHTHIHTKADS